LKREVEDRIVSLEEGNEMVWKGKTSGKIDNGY